MIQIYNGFEPIPHKNEPSENDACMNYQLSGKWEQMSPASRKKKRLSPAKKFADKYFLIEFLVGFL